MNGVVKIQNQEVAVKEYGGQRVITFKDVDSVHDRPMELLGEILEKTESDLLKEKIISKLVPTKFVATK